MMTCREAQELAMYDSVYPIDDQSNFQVPSANLAALYANSHREQGDPIHPITDFMPFFEHPMEDEFVDLDAKFRNVFAGIAKTSESE